MTGRVTLPPLRSGDFKFVNFDFTGQTITGTLPTPLNSQTATATLYSGTDASPSTLIGGVSRVAGTSNVQVQFTATGKPAGNIYVITVTATTATEIATITAFLAIIPATP